jgi:hypothetical protein
VATHAVVLIGYLAAGVAATWPRATDLAGRVPATTDAESYVWALWWVARQAAHFHDPWFTGYMAAPAGVQLGFDTLMPLLGLVMAPVTLTLGPGTSFTLATLAMPGLLCYTAYRAARLWVPTQAGALAAGAFFGLSTMLTWQDELHLNLAAGELFLPMALEAAVRLRRQPGRRQAVILGLVLGAAPLVNQESAILVLILAALVLVLWLFRRPSAGRLRPAALAGLVAALAASPQLIAMAWQLRSGGATAPAASLAHWAVTFGTPAATLFAPSPRLAQAGLTGLASAYQYAQPGEGRPVFGLALSALAVLGTLVAWRRRSARALALLWIGSAALALGPVLLIGDARYIPLAQTWHGARVSAVLPYTWLVRVPGLSAFREADRFALLGLLPAALLAGMAVDWLRKHAMPLLVPALALGLLEAGWSGTGAVPAAMPALDRPIASDHSGSIVVDVPFGLRGGLPEYGDSIPARALLLATQDAHPRAISYTSWVPAPAIAAIQRHPFYLGLVSAQDGNASTAARLAAARSDARRMHVEWVLVWRNIPGVPFYLLHTGFRPVHRADGVTLYRQPGPVSRRAVPQ